MKTKVFKIIKNWREEINDIDLGNIFVFGSLISNNGRLFNPEVSDIDLVIIIPEKISKAHERREWLKTLKDYKSQLELALFQEFKRNHAMEQIVSIVAVTKAEIDFNVHKGSVRNFFSINYFWNIDENSGFFGREKFKFKQLENEFLIQILEAIQKSRNKFLKIATNKNFNELEWSGSDILPKALTREFAKFSSIKEGESSKGDEFSLSFGTDLIKQTIKDLRHVNDEFYEIYTWIDARSGGRSNSIDKDILCSQKHLLLYEVLYDLVIEQIQINATNQRTQMANNSQVKINENFKVFLEDTDLLSKAHSRTNKVQLGDIFIPPLLSKFNPEKDEVETKKLKSLIPNFDNDSKLIIVGEGQSGKSTVCKVLFQDLFNKGYIPIFLNDKTNQYKGNIEYRIKKRFLEQYESEFDFDNFKPELIVPIIDDFHYAKHKEKHIEHLKKYPNQIIIVDDIYGINLKEGSLTEEYTRFKIEEFTPTLRNELIKNWVLLSDTNYRTENEIYRELDNKRELVDKALGKIIGSGIMPAYPFFILSIISSYDTFQKPLDQEITSQGHCYQALIYMYLRKEGVKNDEIDSYINFLTKLSFYHYSLNKSELNEVEFLNFIDDYKSNYNLTTPKDVLLRNLRNTNILHYDNLGNYTFGYPYLYYFFVAKYFSENIEEEKETIDYILNNLHKDDFAYIAIFISHHSKDTYILDEIILNAMCLFESFQPATLSKAELAFFDDKIKEITEAVLPASNISPEKVREKLLEKEDEYESNSTSSRQDAENKLEKDDANNDLALEMRRSIKTVEVMGRIIKNRAGSLEKEKLEIIFQEGMNVHLRILSSFIELIKNEDSQKMIESMIVSRLNLILNKKNRVPDKKKLIAMAKSLFWNINYNIIGNLTDKIIHSLGSDKLTSVIENVCIIQDTPATFSVKHGILQWYNKNLQIRAIAERITEKDFSKTAKSLIKHRVVQHCNTHVLGYKEYQKVSTTLKIPQNILTKKGSKKK